MRTSIQFFLRPLVALAWALAAGPLVHAQDKGPFGPGALGREISAPGNAARQEKAPSAGAPAAISGIPGQTISGVNSAVPPPLGNGQGAGNPGNKPTTTAAELASDKVSLNFVNADIDAVVQAVSQATGKRFMIDPRVKGTVNVISAQPVPRSLTYDILLSALRLQGFAIVESNGIARIVPANEAKTYGGMVRSGRKPANGEQVMTQVFHIENQSATQLVAVLQPLAGVGGSVTAYAASNTLVVTDYASNLRRLAQIISAIDVADGGMTETIVLKNAAALDMATTLTKLFTEQGPAANEAGQRVVILADARTNSLLVRADNPAKIARIKKMAASLDQPLVNLTNIHVVPLKNADALRLAQTLRSIVTGDAGSLNPPPATPSLAPATNSSGMSGSSSSSGSSAGIGQGSLFANSQNNPQNANQPVSTGGGSGANTALGGMIQADTATNSLIIIAPEAIYRDLRNVIAQLDKRRLQVHIEALVVEISGQLNYEFGIQWQGGKTNNSANGAVVGGTNFGVGGQNIIGLEQSLYAKQPTVSPGLNVGVINRTVGLGFLLRALESDQRANILSTPNVVTLDNETASIIVGQNVPFVTGSYTQASTGVSSPFQTYDRQDVGLSLKVKPQVTDGGVVRVQIYQEVSSLVAGSASNPAGPTTNKRAVETSVMVHDGGIIALGGLVQDNLTDNEDKVPGLGDLPLIGGLFRYKSKSRIKTNLMIFVRPKVIRSDEDIAGIAAARYDNVRSDQLEYRDLINGGTIGGEPPLLPPLPTLQQRPPGDDPKPAQPPAGAAQTPAEPPPAQPAASDPVAPQPPTAAPLTQPQ